MKQESHDVSSYFARIASVCTGVQRSRYRSYNDTLNGVRVRRLVEPNVVVGNDVVIAISLSGRVQGTSIVAQRIGTEQV